MIIVSLQERHLLAIVARARAAVGHVPPFGRRGIIHYPAVSALVAD